MSQASFDLLDGRAARVLRRLHAEADRQMPRLLLKYLPLLPRLLLGQRIDFKDEAREFYADKYIALGREQAAFCYLTARALRARQVVEFGTSFGISTIWLAAAVRDNGGGKVIGTEFVPAKARRAREHVDEAGLGDYVEIREGDARETLRSIDGEVDFFLNDGFPMLALDILKLVAPHMRRGAVVLTDNVGHFRGNYREYVAYLREPRNGFQSMTMPIRAGTEYSVRTAAGPRESGE
ncbi:Predicted O-methyltransferase YrrM [Nannocystis exedens]|uniref:Predicted O-methyltransferase YrrM n=1 Tax=Nannocystis exedens TaxID=54 RepID=A0A1I2IMV2_9BACT|nr:class I SAM-dependent methyltransferase [Nannocystis exedens]PCC74976.1 O-methyltransferase [Nannocystis exedens]SFF42948.1 Predicted O-methyltransferase YrrM [Nannocystis exedens]